MGSGGDSWNIRRTDRARRLFRTGTTASQEVHMADVSDRDNTGHFVDGQSDELVHVHFGSSTCFDHS